MFSCFHVLTFWCWCWQLQVHPQFWVQLRGKIDATVTRSQILSREKEDKLQISKRRTWCKSQCKTLTGPVSKYIQHMKVQHLSNWKHKQIGAPAIYVWKTSSEACLMSLDTDFTTNEEKKRGKIFGWPHLRHAQCLCPSPWSTRCIWKYGEKLLLTKLTFATKSLKDSLSTTFQICEFLSHAREW